MTKTSKKFYFGMQHNPTVIQAEAARAMGTETVLAMCRKPEPKKPGDAEPTPGVEYLNLAGLLNVPEDVELPREWFVKKAEEIVNALGVQSGDVLHFMGQFQLTAAVNAHGRRIEAVLRESVTKRVSVDVPQSDGTVKRELVFNFEGYRPVYEF